MTAQTWRTKSGIIMFHLAAETGGAPARAMRRVAAAFVAEAPAIGVADAMAISTRDGGEDAREWFGALGPAQLAELDHHDDLTRIEMSCDLVCTAPDGAQITVVRGLHFWVQLATDDAPPDAPLEVNLTLDTDIYLATTWADARDNRAIAERNAPAFNRFYARFLAAAGCTVEDVSADSYRGQVDASGVVL